ncbi:ABC transporter permease [Candidatus Woesebacteria bacterium]|nr:ABC transporter permease [Candidatus Woesebacteria bacterium]
MFRSLQQASRNMRRSPYQALLATSMMALTFFVAYCFVLLLYTANVALHYIETRPQVIAYFAVTASPEEVTAAQQIMEQKDYVAEVKAVNKQDALQIFKEENSKDPLLLELVTADILPASLEVSATSIESLSTIQGDLEKQPGVEEVVYQKDVIENLSYWTKAIRTGGLVITTVLVVITVMLIFVILSLRVGMKRSEISIMRLLGASMWYIRGPFVYEGVSYGVYGALIGWVVSYTVLLYLTPTLLSFFAQLKVLPVPPVILAGMLGGGVLIGVCIGIISSFFAVKRFVRKGL